VRECRCKTTMSPFKVSQASLLWTNMNMRNTPKQIIARTPGIRSTCHRLGVQSMQTHECVSYCCRTTKSLFNASKASCAAFSLCRAACSYIPLPTVKSAICTYCVCCVFVCLCALTLSFTVKLHRYNVCDYLYVITHCTAHTPICMYVHYIDTIQIRNSQPVNTSVHLCVHVYTCTCS
jgi:hypothetical protein